MRPITRNAALAILAVVVVLLALGAVPSYLRAGDPYYVTATPVADPPVDGAALNGSLLSERRYPYTTGAIAAADAAAGTPGRSAPYWKGPTGFKEAFTHSPFDEFAALEQYDRRSNATAVDDRVAYVRHDGTVYRLEMRQRA